LHYKGGYAGINFKICCSRLIFFETINNKRNRRLAGGRSKLV